MPGLVSLKGLFYLLTHDGNLGHERAAPGISLTAAGLTPRNSKRDVEELVTSVVADLARGRASQHTYCVRPEAK